MITALRKGEKGETLSSTLTSESNHGIPPLPWLATRALILAVNSYPWRMCRLYSVSMFGPSECTSGWQYTNIFSGSTLLAWLLYYSPTLLNSLSSGYLVLRVESILRLKFLWTFPQLRNFPRAIMISIRKVQYSKTKRNLLLTPPDEVVELEWGWGIKYVSDHPGVKISSFDEHPKDGGYLSKHQSNKHQLTKVSLKNSWFSASNMSYSYIHV